MDEKSTYVATEIAIIQNMNDEQLADYLSGLLAQVHPDVIAFIERRKGADNMSLDDIFVRDGLLYVPVIMLMNGIKVEDIRRTIQEYGCFGPITRLLLEMIEDALDQEELSGSITSNTLATSINSETLNSRL